MGEALITRRGGLEGLEVKDVTFSWGYGSGVIDGWTNYATSTYPLVDGVAANVKDFILVQHTTYPNDPSRKLFAYFDSANQLWRLYNATIYSFPYEKDKGYKARLIKGFFT